MKMNNWNLKNKKWEIQPNSFGEVIQRKKSDDEYEYGTSCETVYTEEDIEILRLKLINDIKKNLIVRIKGIDDNDVPIQKILNLLYNSYEKTVIEIINRRFGVYE